MRKILLATTAVVGIAFAGVAQAATQASPISLNVGGYNDFVAGIDHGGANNTGGAKAVNRDFEDEYKLSFDALGKAANGVEYGANIAFWNGKEASTGWSNGGTGVTLNSAYVWLSGAFGKVLFGDEHGASDLVVYAPTVGEGQIDGRYMDFVNSNRNASFLLRAAGFDNTEHSTKITYYTPKVGNDTNKVQLGVSYAPSLYNYGQSVVNSSSAQTVSPYNDIVKGALQYTGNFKPVNVTASADIVHGGNGHNFLNTTTFGGAYTPTGVAKSFNAWGFGTQVAYNGFTLGGAYHNLGAYNVVDGQSNNQEVYNVGLKYEFDKVGVAASWLHGQGYDNLLSGFGLNHVTGASTQNTNYVSNYDALGTGATYTWFPGLTSNVDGVIYDQKVRDETGHEGGYTVLVSQRLAF